MVWVDSFAAGVGALYISQSVVAYGLGSLGLVVVVVFWVLVVGGFWLVVFGMFVGGFYVGVGCGIVVF